MAGFEESRSGIPEATGTKPASEALWTWPDLAWQKDSVNTARGDHFMVRISTFCCQPLCRRAYRSSQVAISSAYSGAASDLEYLILDGRGAETLVEVEETSGRRYSSRTRRREQHQPTKFCSGGDDPDRGEAEPRRKSVRPARAGERDRDPGQLRGTGRSRLSQAVFRSSWHADGELRK